ncbi:MAG: N-acetylmuramoyl-L-alanine amidase [Hyphomicrobium sp.]
MSLAFFAYIIWDAASAAPKPAVPSNPPAYATAAQLTQSADQTVFALTLSRGVTAEIFTLDNPYRVIVDLPSVAFRLPAGTGDKSLGHIKVFRYGLFAEHKARVVIETTEPVAVASAFMERSGKKGAVILKIALKTTDPASFTAAMAKPDPRRDESGAEAPSEPKLDPKPPGKHKGRPIIVVDAGHGGIDPGAIGNGVSEKDIVFAVAGRLADVLRKSGRYEVRMTRTTDVFVSLDKRVKMSADFGADLFISLHADSISETQFAESVRGATVYTLSERASDEGSRLMAEKENASDLIAGLSWVGEKANDEVRDILFDLMQRETSNFSADFSNLLVTRLQKSIVMSRDPQKSAAFKVLKQTHAPSVLVELGYMSNSKDQHEMTTTAWQLKVSGAIKAAIDQYFNKRTAVQR